jgi:DNA-binding XRE family transcriptional regulator
MITREQVKAARQLLRWSQMALALEADLAQTTIGSIEAGKKNPSKATLSIIQHALEKAGVVFLDDDSVRLR